MHHGNGALSILDRGGRVRSVLECKLPQLCTYPSFKIGDSGKYFREDAIFGSIRNNAVSLPVAD